MPSALRKALLVSLVAATPCACGGVLGVVVADYPVSGAGTDAANPPAAAAGTAGADAAPPKNRYWSANVFVEPQDVKRLWSDSGSRLRYALVTARVRIPAHPEPLVRDFPLYTLEDGTVQTQAGVDLFQKIPLLDEAREPISVSIEVTAFQEPEALATAKRVLDETAKLAQPVLADYPLASRILSGGTAIVDALVPAEQRRKNSATKVVTGQPRDGMVMAFLLRPVDQAERQPMYSAEIVPCIDKPEALCRKDATRPAQAVLYRTSRVDDVVYATVSFRAFANVYDPLIDPGDSCELVTAASVAQAREYMAANEALFHPDDVLAAHAMFAAADKLLHLRELAARNAVEEMADFLALGGYYSAPGDGNRPVLDKRLTTMAQCLKSKATIESPGVVAWDLLKAQRNPRLAPRCDKVRGACDPAIAPVAFRLDVLGDVLTALATSTGAAYSVLDGSAFARTPSLVVKALQQEAVVLATAQRDELTALTKAPAFRCENREQAEALLATTGVYCRECMKTLETACARHDAREAIAAKERLRRELASVTIAE